MSRTAGRYDADQLQRLSDTTIAYYDRFARAFWEGTRHHDVSQNYAALLNAIEGEPPFSILDLGCGPGRDLSHFRSLGHEAVGLDGSRHFVAMARSHSQCEVFHQDFLAMQLPENRFGGIFANASLFHVPSQELPRVLLELFKTLRPHGVLFSSNPRGNNEEGLSDDRYACFFDFDTWRDYVTLPASWRWAITIARRGGRGINNPGSRPFGARASPPGWIFVRVDHLDEHIEQRPDLGEGPVPSRRGTESVFLLQRVL